MRWHLLAVVWLFGCTDSVPGADPPVDAAPPDLEAPDATPVDAAPPLPDASPDRALPDATVDAALLPDQAVPCHDGDADGVSDCRGDCDDADPAIRPGAVEPCDGQDADCDGVVDERCVQAGDAVQWLPVARSAAQTVGGPEQPAFSLDLPPLADFRILIDLAIVERAPEAGDPVGLIELRFADDGPPAIIPLRPERPLVMDYRGRAVPMDGQLGTGGPVQMIVERVGGRFRAGVGTGTPGILHVPAPILPALRFPADLRRVIATCQGCQMRIDRLDVARPFIAPPRPWHACANRLRNAAFAHQTDGAPDRWRVDVPWTHAGALVEPGHWRRQLEAVRVDAAGVHLPGGAPQVALSQPVTLDGACRDWTVRLDGAGRVAVALEAPAGEGCPCVARDGAIALPGVARFEGCAGPARLRVQSLEDDAILRHAGLTPTDAEDAPPCVAWPDRPPPRLPVPWIAPWIDPADGHARVPLRRPDGRLAGADVIVAIDKTVDVSYPALGGHVDIIWRVRRGAPALISLRLPARFPATIELPLPGAHVVREGGLQVVHVPDSGEIASIAPTVTPTIDNPLAFAPVRLPPGEGELPPPIPAARFTGRPRQLVAGPPDQPFGAAEVDFVRALGLGGVSVADPEDALLPGIFAAAARPRPLAVDLHLTRYGSIWAHDGLEPYAEQAREIAATLATCAPCGPIGLTALDQPLQAPLRRCAAEVAISPPSELAPAITDCEGCDPLVACRRAFPSLIAALFATLRAALPATLEVGVNLSDGGLVAELPAAVFSFTSDWIRQDTAWSQSALERMALIAGRLAGNTPVSATDDQRAPSAAAHQALVLQLAALGAQPIRLTHWPPDSGAILSAAIRLEAAFERVWPTFPARLSARLDTDHHRVWAAAYGDDLLLVINRTAQRQSVRVDPGPLLARLPAALSPVIGEGTVRFEPAVGLLRVGLAPHAAALVRLER